MTLRNPYKMPPTRNPQMFWKSKQLSVNQHIGHTPEIKNIIRVHTEWVRTLPVCRKHTLNGMCVLGVYTCIFILRIGDYQNGSGVVDVSCWGKPPKNNTPTHTTSIPVDIIYVCQSTHGRPMMVMMFAGERFTHCYTLLLWSRECVFPIHRANTFRTNASSRFFRTYLHVCIYWRHGRNYIRINSVCTAGVIGYFYPSTKNLHSKALYQYRTNTHNYTKHSRKIILLL